MAKLTKAQQAERQEAIENLRSLIQPGTTVYAIVRHVASSGMSRTIDLIFFKDNEPRWIRYNVALVLGRRLDDNNGGIYVGGYGSDACADLVHDLGLVLFNDGYALNMRRL